ncbi:major facilitator superfamily domain-containing protein [Ditylenchus destructor]|nr:major facilitator superfamily domain-containing protein [Ditylenchus destructor]
MTIKPDEKRILKKDEEGAVGLPVTNWRSIYVAAALSFVGSAQFSLYFSSLWPYLQIIDRSISETFFGYIIAIYSIGQIISSPTFGYWSNRIKTIRLPLFVGLFMMLIGNALYICLELGLPIQRRYLLLLGRFITGMGSGNVSLLRTYASTASTSKDRPRAIAFVTCGQALGMTSGPAFQLFFTTLKYPGIHMLGNLRFNLYTAPAWLACAMNVFGALALYFLFREEYAGLLVEENRNGKTKMNKIGDSIECGIAKKAPSYDLVAVFVCYLTRFTQMFINTNLETLGSPFSMMMFGWTEANAVTFTSAAQGAIGFLTFATYVAYITFNMENFLNFRASCILSLGALIIFHFITYSWPFIPGNVPMYNSTSIWELEKMDGPDEPVGCNTDKFEWCEELRPVNVGVYYAAYILVIGLAFPTLNIAMNTLFSKIIGPRWQGTQQGILQVSGGLARMVGPVLISILYSTYGPTMAWKMEILVITFTLISWLIFYRRMVPLKAIQNVYKNISPPSSLASENESIKKGPALRSTP